MKIRNIAIYIASVVVPMAIAALVCKLALHMDIVMTVFIGLAAGFLGGIVCRLVWHAVKNDWTQSFGASIIWETICFGLFTWLVFNTSGAIQTSLVFGIIASAVNAFGFCFIAGSREKVLAPVEKEPSRKEKISELAQTLRYKFMEDGITPNLDAPLCVDADGHHLTPAEADGRGLGAQYAEAIEYIKTIV